MKSGRETGGKVQKAKRKNYLFILYAHPHISLPLFHGPRDDGLVVALDQKWKHFFYCFLRISFFKPLLDIVWEFLFL